MEFIGPAFLVLLLLAAGCKGSGAADGPTDAGAGDAQDEGDGAIPCGASGLSKGPWSLAINDTTAKIRWEACRPGTNPTVAYVPETGGTEQQVDATETPTVTSVTSLAPLAPKQAPDYAGTWYMHEASLSGLAPATCYSYRLLTDATTKARLCTARNPGDAIRLMAIGDTNPALGGTAPVLAHTLPMNPDFILHGGDIQYYDSLLETWASWFPVMQPLLNQGGFFPAIGNHESETPTEFTEYTERFFGNAGFDGTEQYFRIESGGVWFFALDTEEPLDLSSPQGQWLASSMADAASQPGYRFGVVYFHKPFVTCGDTGDDPTARQEFEPLFLQHKVPLILQAHMHGYERFEFPNITYVTTGGGGGALGNVDANTARTYCSSRVASGAFFHATILDVDRADATSDAGVGDAGAGDASAADAGSAPMFRGTVIDDQGAIRDTFAHPTP
jgi:hypothetical protein